MKFKDKIIRRLDQLIALGEQAVEDDDLQLSTQFQMGVNNLIDQTFSIRNIYSVEIGQLYGTELRFDRKNKRYLGIIKALKEDLENEMFDLKTIIEADMFNDFLTQAEQLIDRHYYQPATVIIGSVLEDGLRKLCLNNEIELPDNPRLEWMSTQLSKHGVINRPILKFITTYSNLKDNAAHGKWDLFTEDDTLRFFEWTRQFMERYFSTS